MWQSFWAWVGENPIIAILCAVVTWQAIRGYFTRRKLRAIIAQHDKNVEAYNKAISTNARVLNELVDKVVAHFKRHGDGEENI